MEFKGYETFQFTRRDRILTATIDSGDAVNSVDARLHRDLARVFYDLGSDPDSDVIVLASANKAFCAGGNIDWFQDLIDDQRKFEHVVSEAKRIVFSLLELEKPIICRLNGAAAGLGATIALLCDIVVASEKAQIGDPHTRMGLVAGDGGAVIWPQLIGFNKAKELLMTGEMLRAAEAHRIGLVNYVVPPEELDAKVYGLAEQLVHGATKAIRWTKTVANIPLREIAQKTMDASLAYELATNASADHQEAVSAFREKRAPKFTGR